MFVHISIQSLSSGPRGRHTGHTTFALQKHLKNTQKHIQIATFAHFEATWPEQTPKTHKNTQKHTKTHKNTHKNTQKHTKTHKNTQKQHAKTHKNSARSHFGATWLAQTSQTGSLRGHFGVTGLAQTSARGHFGATSGPPGSPRPRLGVTSGSPRDHLARENSARGHFGVTWLKKTWLEVTSRSQPLQPPQPPQLCGDFSRRHLKNICGNSSSKRLGLKVTLRHSALLAFTRGWISSGSH